MSSRLIEIFEDRNPSTGNQGAKETIFQLAEMESSRAGKIGMEVGSLRERIIVSLLIYKFGGENVETAIPITEPEVDVKLFGQPISIKTITGKRFGGVKLIWTVDAQKAREFRKSYYPHCDVLFVQINWGSIGGLYYIPLEAQRKLFDRIGKEKYIKLPKLGTNPRGVEITKDALETLAKHKESRAIEINWQKAKIDYNLYKRWVDYWKED